MRASQFLLATMKEKPADAELVSHQLMLRAGLIRKLASGIYSWLPLGLRVLRKVEHIVREEMNRSGALEVLLPAVQPAELWEETDRWGTFGKQLLTFHDRHEHAYCFGPTHEEVITDLLRNELKSYKQLPLNVYQIQTKFRDEIRPRFGVMRAREFIMKDAYSFHTDETSLAETYEVMYDTYSRIFDRIGLRYRAVLADTGSIGGKKSHEFQVLADSGEDLIYYSDGSDYAANVEFARALTPQGERAAANDELTLVDTPTQRTIKSVAEFLKVDTTQTIKVLLVQGVDDTVVALILRGDHSLNEIKAAKHPLIANPFCFATDQQIVDTCGCEAGFIGPIGLDIPILADHSAVHLANFICGANQQGKHYTHVNWERDANYTEAVDLRQVVPGDLSPDGKGSLHACRGIEVGHVFQLGSKYSEAMHATVLDKNGKAIPLIMGCYGLGISRVVAAAIEQNHDEHGIIWPKALAPFDIALLPINMHKSQRVRDAAEELYTQLCAAGFDVFFDDRKERPGVMFADSDLIGIPRRVVLGERGLNDGTIEYKERHSNEVQTIKLDELLVFLQEGK